MCGKSNRDWSLLGMTTGNREGTEYLDSISPIRVLSGSTLYPGILKVHIFTRADFAKCSYGGATWEKQVSHFTYYREGEQMLLFYQLVIYTPIFLYVPKRTVAILRK